MPAATINGFEMYYEVRGEGYPVAFIHGGFGGMASTLGPRAEPWVPAFLDAGYQVIAYDRRAAGRSGYPDAGYSLENFARDLRELLRHARVERAYVMGASAGGPIALTYALEYPETVEAIVLVNTAPALLTEPRVVERMRARVELLEREGPEAAYDARRDEPLGLQELLRRRGAAQGLDAAAATAQAAGVLAAVRERIEAVRERIEESSREDRARWYAGETRNYGAYLDVDLAPRLGELRMSAFVIHGDADSVVPVQGARALAEGIANAELRVLPGAEHGLMTNTGEAPAAIVEFLQRHDADRR